MLVIMGKDVMSIRVQVYGFLGKNDHESGCWALLAQAYFCKTLQMSRIPTPLHLHSSSLW